MNLKFLSRPKKRPVERFLLCLALPALFAVVVLIVKRSDVYGQNSAVARPFLGILLHTLSNGSQTAESSTTVLPTPTTEDALRHEAGELNVSGLLSWDGGPLPTGSPHWQRLDIKGDAFVYSAHYDDDTGGPPIVRVVGIARNPLPYTSIWCRFYIRNGSMITRNPVISSGDLSHFRLAPAGRHSGVFVICPLTDIELRPFAVAVDSEEDSVRTTFLEVHYYSQKHYLWNITRCYPAFHDRYNDHIKFAEMVAASKVLGVDHFVFYVESVGPSQRRMLQVLEEAELAEVHPWNLHPYAHGMLVFNVAQYSAIEDCLYRHRHTSRYLIFGDVDELFVPRSRDNLLPLLAARFTEKPSCGAYVIRGAFFDLQLPEKLPIVANVSSRLFVDRNKLPALSHPTRYARIFGPKQHAKSAVDPRKVEEMDVHEVNRFRQGFESCTLDPEDGLLHHYRHVFNSRKVGPNQTDDAYLWNFTDAIVHMTRRLLDRYNDTSFKSVDPVLS